MLAQLRVHTNTFNGWAHNSVQSDNWAHTCIQIVTWSHTAETTLAVTQTLPLVATVSVSFAGPRTCPPPLLSQKSLRTWPCCDTTHTITPSQQLSLRLLLLHSWPLVKAANAEGRKESLFANSALFSIWRKVNSVWVAGQTFATQVARWVSI